MSSNYNTPYDNQFNNNIKETSPFIEEPIRIRRSLMEQPSVEFGAERIGNMFENVGGFKSIDEGMSVEDLEDINEHRAQNQSGWDLFGKAIGQSVNELTLGTLEGLGYLADADNTVVNALAGKEQEFDNWWSVS